MNDVNEYNPKQDDPDAENSPLDYKVIENENGLTAMELYKLLQILVDNGLADDTKILVDSSGDFDLLHILRAYQIQSNGVDNAVVLDYGLEVEK